MKSIKPITIVAVAAISAMLLSSCTGSDPDTTPGPEASAQTTAPPAEDILPQNDSENEEVQDGDITEGTEDKDYSQGYLDEEVFFFDIVASEYSIPQSYYDEGIYSKEQLDSLPKEALAVMTYLKDYSSTKGDGSGPETESLDLIIPSLQNNFSANGLEQLKSDLETGSLNLLAIFPGYINQDDLDDLNGEQIDTNYSWLYYYYDYTPGYLQDDTTTSSKDTLTVPTSISIKVTMASTSGETKTANIWGNIYWYYEDGLGWVVDSYELAS